MLTGHSLDTLDGMVFKSAVASFLGHVQRIVDRTFHRREFGQNIAARCRRHLARLDRSEQSFAFLVALHHIAQDFELLREEAALTPEGLGLQRKIVALASRFDIAQAATQKIISAPTSQLSCAIVAQACADGASHVRVDFQSENGAITVFYRNCDAWTEACRVPSNLERPLRGALTRLASMGIEAIARSEWVGKTQIHNVSMVSANEQCMELKLGDALGNV